MDGGISATIRKCLPLIWWRNSREIKWFFSPKVSFLKGFVMDGSFNNRKNGGFLPDGKLNTLHTEWEKGLEDILFVRWFCWKCLKMFEVQKKICTEPKVSKDSIHVNFSGNIQFYGIHIWRSSWDFSSACSDGCSEGVGYLSTNSSSDSLYMSGMKGWTPQEDSFCTFSLRNP